MLIGSLSLHELATLETRLFPAVPEDVGGWQSYVHALRRRCEDALQLELGTPRPGMPKAPAYDANQGPAGYIQQVRQATLEAGLTRYHFSEDPHVQRERFVKDYATGHLARPEIVSRRPVLSYREDDLVSFFKVNFTYLMTTARVIAKREYNQQRAAIFEKFLPNLHYHRSASLDHALENGEVNKGQVRAVKEALRSLPFRAPVADFFQLDLEQLFKNEKPTRQAIITAFGHEVWELCELLHDVEPAMLSRSPYRTGALAFLPAHELRVALEDNPFIDPIAICRAYLRYPHAFRQKLALLQAKSNREAPNLRTDIPDLDA